MAESTVKMPPLTGPLTVPPYVSYRSYRNFLDSLKQGIPARIDRSVMASMSGALQSQLTTALRYLNLTKPLGQPTEMLAKIVNSEGPERAKAMREMLAAAYPFLFGSFDLKSATPRMLEEQFSEAGASGGTLDKCMLFFLAAAKDAEIELSPHLKNPRVARTSGSRTPRTRQATRLVDANSTIEDDLRDISTEQNGNVSWEQMLLSKFPSFDPAWPDEVKSKWFDGFHRLMRVGKPEPKE
jgi:hypothetical protein